VAPHLRDIFGSTTNRSELQSGSRGAPDARPPTRRFLRNPSQH
jgi:hypothetical protein